MSKFISFIEDHYELTGAGYYLAVAILLLVIFIAASFISKRQNTKEMTAKGLTFAGVAVALAFITSYVKYELPMGGSVTLFSMFFVCLVGYTFGIRIGLSAAFAYSILQFIQTGGKYFLTPFQTCCDYFFAFTALGIVGFWYGKKKGLITGYVVAALVRGLFHTLGGYIFWMDYMPESFPKSLAAVYPIVYNYSYILIEMAITLIIINIPAVKGAIEKVIASVSDNKNNTEPSAQA
ncbi:energy-coupled thiamine transporter ThiT [Butyrivibrio sp. INlla21]|uniref:energy-coupled thiamine transporter ThiT n=1 Tax=Butyrivibrio sp. INlla21 TaxID=1520811 RepID=UPI0008E50F46|nr:energy-coupled thiamine transporter ThiT [Butyrivibrio sp. INlla21]SFV04429.1 thiamine transporter [Butyrivibrio sp. INlla21]